MPLFRFAGLTVEIEAPDRLLHKNLKTFSCGSGVADIHCRVVFAKRPLQFLSDARVIAETPVRTICEKSGNTYILGLDDEDVPCCIAASGDWTSFDLYVSPEARDLLMSEKARDGESNLFMGLRQVFTAALAQKNGILIHCAAIDYRGRSLLFSAKSGTGKSTHTRLWRQRYDVRVLDGDVAACRLVDGAPVVYGLPWCGSSSEFLNGRASLRAIVFLEQSPENHIRKLPLPEAVLRLAARNYLPMNWSGVLAGRVMDTVQSIAEAADCFLLQCRPDMEAVELVRKCIES